MKLLKAMGIGVIPFIIAFFFVGANALMEELGWSAILRVGLLFGVIYIAIVIAARTYFSGEAP